MKRVTVSKHQIAQADKCANMCEKYSKGLETVISMLELVAPFGLYNKLPDEFKLDQKKSIQTIIRDLRSMVDQSNDIVLKKRLCVEELSNERTRQLEESK